MKAVAIIIPPPKLQAKLNTDAGTAQRGILRVTMGKSVVRPDETRRMKMAPMRRPMEPSKASEREPEH